MKRPCPGEVSMLGKPGRNFVFESGNRELRNVIHHGDGNASTDYSIISVFFKRQFWYNAHLSCDREGEERA